MEHTLHITMVKLLLCLLTANVCSVLKIESYVTLKTKFATIIGTLERLDSTTSTMHGSDQDISYFAFRGIPYAEPTVGPLRWKDPVLKRAYPKDVILDATTDKSPCPQWINKNGSSALIGDENCLYASIFMPTQRANNSSKIPFKIMVFFHGGGFIVNANRNMLPIPLLAQKNCIIIMFNYRISIFGYLSTGTSLLPGNYAFLDQIALLKWVQMHGRDFGGDPNDVTIFGSSIGSVSIHYLLLSKLASGLFHKAIMESGSALCERSLVPNPLEISMKLGAALGCPTVYQELLVACLRSKSTDELMVAAKSLTSQWVLPSVLGPVIDKTSRPPKNQFLPDFPENIPIINKVPIIIGITKNEGLTAFVKLSKEFSLEQLRKLEYIQDIILPHYLNLIMRQRKQPSQRHYFIENLTTEVMIFYREDFIKDPISTLVGILGDLWINTCHRKTLEQLCVNSVPIVHSYLFTHHDAGISPSEIDKQINAFHENGIRHPILDTGVAHTEEILYMLIEEAFHLGHLTRNKQMSDILSGIWTNFAISSSQYAMWEQLLPGGWPKWNPVCYTSGNHSFINPNYPLYEISLDNHRYFYNYRLQEAQFWWKKHQDTH